VDPGAGGGEQDRRVRGDHEPGSRRGGSHEDRHEREERLAVRMLVQRDAADIASAIVDSVRCRRPGA
jgi:hypothetical protein